MKMQHNFCLRYLLTCQFPLARADVIVYLLNVECTRRVSVSALVTDSGGEGEVSCCTESSYGQRQLMQYWKRNCLKEYMLFPRKFALYVVVVIDIKLSCRGLTFLGELCWSIQTFRTTLLPCMRSWLESGHIEDREWDRNRLVIVSAPHSQHCLFGKVLHM